MPASAEKARPQLSLLFVAAIACALVGLMAIGMAARQSANPASVDPMAAKANRTASALFDAALQRASEAGKPLVVDFYADWCPPCRQMESQTFQNADVEAWMENNVIFLKVNVDGERTLAQNYNISSIPTLVVFSPSGRELKRSSGFLPPRDFLKFAQQAVGGTRGGEPRPQSQGLF